MTISLQNCLLWISLCSICGLMLIPFTYSLVSPAPSKLDQPIISHLQSADSSVSLSNQVSLLNDSNVNNTNNLTSLTGNPSILPIDLSSFNGTTFKDNDFMIVSGSNNSSREALMSSIFHNSRKPKKNQSRIFFIPIRSLVPISFNGTTVIFDSRTNSTSPVSPAASAVNDGNVTFVWIEENTNSTVNASSSPIQAATSLVEQPSTTTVATTTTTQATREAVTAATVIKTAATAAATVLTTLATTTTTSAPKTAAVVTPSASLIVSATSTASNTTVDSIPSSTTTLAPSIFHNFNERIFFAPIPPVTPRDIVTPPTTARITVNPNANARSLPVASGNRASPAAVTNSVPIGLLSSDQASSLLRQFALNSSEQLLNSSSPECERQLDQTDSCMRTVLLVNGNIKSPTTFDELDAIYCKNLTGILRCLGGYSKCLHRVPRIIYNFVYLHIKRTLEQVCKNAVFRSEIIFHSRCFVETNELNVVKRVVDQGTLTALYVLKFIPTNKIVGWGCCGYQKMLHDGTQQINQVCKQKTANNTGEFAMGFLHAAASDLVDIGCRKYSSVELCHENLPEAMATFAQLTSGPVPEQRYSPVIPLIEISRRLASSID